MRTLGARDPRAGGQLAPMTGSAAHMRRMQSGAACALLLLASAALAEAAPAGGERAAGRWRAAAAPLDGALLGGDLDDMAPLLAHHLPRRALIKPALQERPAQGEGAHGARGTAPERGWRAAAEAWLGDPAGGEPDDWAALLARHAHRRVLNEPAVQAPSPPPQPPDVAPQAAANTYSLPLAQVAMASPDPGRPISLPPQVGTERRARASGARRPCVCACA